MTREQMIDEAVRRCSSGAWFVSYIRSAMRHGADLPQCLSLWPERIEEIRAEFRRLAVAA